MDSQGSAPAKRPAIKLKVKQPSAASGLQPSYSGAISGASSGLLQAHPDEDAAIPPAKRRRTTTKRAGEYDYSFGGADALDSGLEDVGGRTQRTRGGRSSGRTSSQFGAEGDDDEDAVVIDDDDGDYDLGDDYYSDDEFDEDGRHKQKSSSKAGAKGAAGTRQRKPRAASGKGACRVMDEDDELEEVDHNFLYLSLKPDHSNRPLWVTPDCHIFLETFSPIYKAAYDFLIAIAEPVCRPESVHEYMLTSHSLYAAVSIGLETETIISVLNRLSKVQLSDKVVGFVRDSTQNYGKVKLVLKRNRFFIESPHVSVLQRLAQDSVIAAARIGDTSNTFTVSKALRERAAVNLAKMQEIDLTGEGAAADGSTDAQGGKGAGAPSGQAGKSGAGVTGPEDADGVDGDDEGRRGGVLEIDEMEEAEDPTKEVLSFEISPDMVDKVKERCLPPDEHNRATLNYPLLEEYDFKADRHTPDLNVELKPHVKLRPYQEKSLSKMFGNGRARSGIIVLPCGAGKSLVGVAAAARVRKSCLCLCTSSVSVDQWKHQFQMWTNLQDHQVARFTSENKETVVGVAGVTITTFTMVAFSGKRSEESEKVMEMIRNTEWGLMLLDEVHVVPASMFRKVVSLVKSHCKLGLTATLVREDELIKDLNYLIGPKMYEANWLDLTKAGHIANVQCVEVWCEMTKEFYREYLKKENSLRKQLLYVMNPRKFMACEFLINFHERVRGDKIIVFSDNIWALREYATRLGKPFIYGPTSHAERTRVLHAFKHDPNINTVFLSKVGDNSLDIPEANVLIQISSHAGSRRQEAQRLGRILRAKRGKLGGGREDEYNAFFYTLVSQDTQEMFFSTKRQQFLIDQGYSFKVVPDLLGALPAEDVQRLHYSNRSDQLDLLSRVLTAGIDEAGVEALKDDDAEALAAELAGQGGSRRRVGNMTALTGASGYKYLEIKQGRPGGGGWGGGARKAKGGYQSEVAKSMARKLDLAKK